MGTEKMTPAQALDFLDQVVSTVNTNREGHVRIQEAISVLAEAIKPSADAQKQAATPHRVPSK